MRKQQFLTVSLMLIFLLNLTTSSTIVTTRAQVIDSWTWISGSNSINQLAVYGVKGIEDPSNRPGARQGAATWIDNDGNYWIYGGVGYNNDTTVGVLGDLWKYSISSHNWVWMAGSHLINQVGVHTARGTYNENNHPGGRKYCSSTTDRYGNFWIFGGATSTDALRGDLWCYNTSENAWAWWAGNDVDDYVGNFSTYRVYEFYNRPPARSGCSMWAGIHYDIIYVFGGYVPSASYGNDLWAYSLDLDNWAWVSGSNLTDLNGVYGPKGDEHSSYSLGSRSGMSSWITNDGYMWIFGGYGKDSVGSLSYLNDLWRYNVTEDAWAWISGSNYTGESGSYGIKGLYGSTYTPGARTASTSCTDIYGNLLLFGGAAGIGVRFNDLWQYNSTQNKWRWISGNYTLNAIGNYGTKGITDLSSYPGARQSSTIRCDSNGEIWLFGGYGYDAGVTTGYLNDLWIYVPLDLVIINEFSKTNLILTTMFMSTLIALIYVKRKRN